MKSHSCNESGMVSLKSDDQGNFSFGYHPAVIGKTEGPFELIFYKDEMKPLKIKHYWGKVAFIGPKEYKTLKNKLPFPEQNP